MSSFLGRAEALRRQGNEGAALKVLEEGLMSRPGHVAAQVARARCLIALGRLTEAEAQLAQTLARDPLQLAAARLRVEIALRLRDGGAARTALAAYRQLGSQDPDLALLERKVAELPVASGDVRPEPAEPKGGEDLVTATLGNLYLAQGHRREAESIFRRLLTRDPDDREARSGLARAIAPPAAPTAVSRRPKTGPDAI